MSFWQKNELLFVVFLTGAIVLVVEIVAARILAPFFGNTIFSYSSIISVILAALSFGYYWGGRLSEKRPEEKIFYTLILIAGIFVLAINFLTSALLSPISGSLSLISGPLIASIILFFAPGLLLGTLSPFCIKLQTLRFQSAEVGKISGEVFFWSTLGSILGSLSAGFFLIPSFGVRNIIYALGLILITIGFIGRRRKIEIKNLVLLTIVLIFSSLIGFPNPRTKPGVVYEAEGRYERLQIYDATLPGGHPARFLKSELNNSSAIYLDSNDMVFDYTKYYELYKFFKPNPKEILVLGAGTYTIPQAYLQNLSEVAIDVVDIEPSLLDLTQKYFRLEKNPHLKTHTADGRKFLAKSEKQYDIIVSDLYLSVYSIPTHVMTKEYFDLCFSHLSENGVFIANLIGDIYEGKNSLVLSALATIKNVFPNSYFFAVSSPKNSGVQNIIALGVKSKEKIGFSSGKYKIRDNAGEINLAEKIIDPSGLNLENRLIFTDNFAPVEIYTAAMLKRYLSRNVAN